jgi:hypothetical protein
MLVGRYKVTKRLGKNEKTLPRLAVDVSEEEHAAFRELCDAIFPGANASIKTVLLKLIRDACKKHNIEWPAPEKK